MEGGYRLFKGGANAGRIDDADILDHKTANSTKRRNRATQLGAIIRKYKDEIAAGKIPKPEIGKERQKGRKGKPEPDRVNAGIRKILNGKGEPLSTENREKIRQLVDMLKTRFGIDICFQKDRNGQGRGYGLVDHSGRSPLTEARS